MTHEQIEAIRNRADKATQGPWHGIYGFDGDATVTVLNYGEIAEHMYDNDADFIANAREDIPALLAEVERLREALEFYGNHGWADGVVETAEGDRFEDAPPIFYDCGKIARDVLGGDA